MYRQYEDPYRLQQELNEVRKRIQELKMQPEMDWDLLADYSQEENELEERINFAWQDDEFDADCRRRAYEEELVKK